jgi:hypothetical protein
VRAVVSSRKIRGLRRENAVVVRHISAALFAQNEEIYEQEIKAI